MSDWSAGQPPRGRRPQGHGGGYDYYNRAGEQRPATPPREPTPGPRPPAGGPPPRPARKKPRWGRRIGVTALVLVLLLAGLVIYADTTLQRTPALEYPERVADTPGTNWLLVGSDSREGLDSERLAELSAGEAIGGRRTDTMMLLHIPEGGGGQPALVSFPRDSSVPIPGMGRNKLNAAFAEGGPTLLAQTIEDATGVHIDRYAEIGLGGFADLVDSVGGVEMCLDKPMDDWRAGVKLPPGCQTLDGPQALGVARARYSLDGGDLERADNQRKLLSALVKKATSPATLLNPFRLVPLLGGAGKMFLVNNGDHVWDLASLAWAMGDVSGENGVTTQVPFGDFVTDDSGQDLIKWDRDKALRMFEAIAKDEPIPADVLSG